METFSRKMAFVGTNNGLILTKLQERKPYLVDWYGVGRSQIFTAALSLQKPVSLEICFSPHSTRIRLATAIHTVL
jgi:hypothetical protein